MHEFCYKGGTCETNMSPKTAKEIWADEVEIVGSSTQMFADHHAVTLWQTGGPINGLFMKGKCVNLENAGSEKCNVGEKCPFYNL